MDLEGFPLQGKNKIQKLRDHALVFLPHSLQMAGFGSLTIRDICKVLLQIQHRQNI
uniref:Uncharacterized protein n=1 Tax=Solanum tuberosum TaxID=4113 RepID=M1D4Q6_SOLTU